MGRKKLTTTVTSTYGLRKITTQDSAKSPSVVSTKIRQQKKLTNVSTSKSSLLVPKTSAKKSATKISKQVLPDKDESKNKSSSTKAKESENDTDDKKIKRLSSKLVWNLKDKDEIDKVITEKGSELPKKNIKNENNKAGTKRSKLAIKNASKTPLKNDGPSTRRRSARNDDLNIEENAGAKVHDLPLKNVAKIPNPPSVKYLPSTEFQKTLFDTSNDTKKSAKNGTEKTSVKSKTPIKNTTEIVKSGRFKSLNKEKEKSTERSKSPIKNTTEISKNALGNSSPSTRRQSGRLKPQITVEDKKESSTSKGSESPKDISPRKKRLIQDVIQNKKHVEEIRAKSRMEIKNTDKNSQTKNSPEPNRVLRKRNIIPNKYKDYSLDSPLLKKKQQPRNPEPVDVYEFQYDPKEEPSKKKINKKYESDSSDDDNNSMKFVVKELRNKFKVVPFGKPKKQKKKAKPIAEKPKIVEYKEVTDKVVTKSVKVSQKEPQISIVPIEYVPLKNLIAAVTSDTNDPPTTDLIDPPDINPSDLDPPVINQSDLDLEPIGLSPDHNNTDSIDLPTDHNNTDSFDLAANHNNTDSIDLPADQNKPETINIPDPSIAARNIVEEVTKSFFEDLSDDESVNNNNPKSPKGLQILSNVVIRQGSPDKAKTPITPNEIFSSTVNHLKPAKPWRIDVPAMRRKPQFFTYKDQSFTPRYEPEFIINDPKSNLKEKIIEDKSKKVKLTYQASIVEYMNGLKPKLINNADNLFKDAPKKLLSPRKILGELNFAQSTPLKPHHENIFKAPNISVISSPKKKSDSMFGFSYFSDDENNKENMRRSPRKSPKKAVIKVQEPIKSPEPVKSTVKEPLKPPKPVNSMVQEPLRPAKPLDSTVQDKENNMKQENVTINETNNSTTAMDSEMSIALFQDYEKDNLEISKKCTRKYVRKNTKRRRLPSVDSLPSDSESESEKPVKKKKKNVKTKEEEREIDRLASHYNSMFEEIEKHELLIE